MGIGRPRLQIEDYVLAHWFDRDMSTRKMAEELHCSTRTIFKVAYELDLPIKPRPLKQDIVGKRFGRLVVTRRDETDRFYVYCKCDCNPDKEIRLLLASIKSGYTRSCGCIRRESSSKIIRAYHEKVQNQRNSVG